MGDDGERQRREVSQADNNSVKQAPNCKPKLDHKENTGNQDRGKKVKSVKPRRSRSTDSERVGRDRGRRRERGPGERRQRGRSEETRRRDRKEGEDEKKKSKPPEDEVEDTECVVCFCSYDNIFKTPKLLSCGHTFCLECLARINVSSAEVKTLTCPVCRELTEIPHGRDLPQLGNNQDIFRKLPPEMQRALSIRFKRNKGKLVLKNTHSSSPTKTNTLTLPKKKSIDQTMAGGDLHLGTVEHGMVQATVVDVGRPPSRVRGRLRQLFSSDRCYYAVVASIITITVALMLVGILAFVVMPNIIAHDRPLHPVNQTLQDNPGSSQPGNPGQRP
ncbi:E3 ubiquitin-protein ligase RNF183 [Lampris incognitus]|uniref:E3 ubiquitin-protein ligase RNF183 n=1 Tax=Lampris incognitus TaxID=2546036 RepID=UPI0024B5730E|nr:E3 ubiquitin-protein ligase RNF183 [Lampris incognitus]